MISPNRVFMKRGGKYSLRRMTDVSGDSGPLLCSVKGDVEYEHGVIKVATIGLKSKYELNSTFLKVDDLN